MAKIYRQTGSLTALAGELRKNGINGFKTIDEIRAFRNGYKESLNQIREKQRNILKREIADLESDCEKLSAEISSGIKERRKSLEKELRELKTELAKMKKQKNFLRKMLVFFRKKSVLKRKQILENSFDQEAEKPFRKLRKQTDDIKLAVEDKKNNTEKWIELYSKPEIKRQENILAVFKENRYLFYGAEGEEKAVRELSKLPDSRGVINDYRLKFSTPIRQKK